MKNHIFSRIEELKKIHEKYFIQSRIINIIDSVNVDLDTEKGKSNLKILIKIQYYQWL